MTKKEKTFKNKRSSFAVKRELKTRRRERENENAADVNSVCYGKDNLQCRCFKKIQKYVACTRRSPYIPDILNHDNQVAWNTVAI